MLPRILRILLSGSMWSFLGVILTVGFFYWSDYRNRFDFQIILDDEVDLVEVRERIADLEIKYKGEDILNVPKALKVVRITLRNLGQTVLQNQYDQLEPFGLRFENASVLDATVLESNAEYLKLHLLQERGRADAAASRIRPSSDPTILRLEKLIFEKGKFATLKVFLLQTKKEPVKVSALGKIANVEHLDVKREQHGQGGKISVAVPVISFLTAYVGVIIGMLSLVFFLHTKQSRDRRVKVRRFLTSHPNLTPDQQAVVQAYRQRWSPPLSQVVRRVAAEDDVLDLREHLRREFLTALGTKGLRGVLASALLRRLGDPLALPKEVFVRDGLSVRFNPTNEEFIRQFFAVMGIIRGKAEPSAPADAAKPPR